MNYENWQDIPGYEGRYQVSNLGRVRSFATNNDGKIIRPTDNGHGYLSVNLHRNGISKKHYIHRLVAFAFVPNPNGFDVVNHLDYDRKNNVPANLEWTTQKANVQYSVPLMRKEKRKCKRTNTGEKYIRSVLYSGSIRYKVQIKRLKIDKWFHTLQEAVRFRNEVIANA